MVCAVAVTGVSKTFLVGSALPLRRRNRASVDALTDVTLTIDQGEIFGLVGRNGYGKTTLIKCICSLIEPTRGRVELFGLDAHGNRQEARRLIGYVSSDERSFYWRLTGRKNLRFFAQLHGIDRRRTEGRIAELSETFQVAPLLDRRFQEYSTGNRQRLSLVRALLHEPRILILDEPTRSLDPFAADSLRVALTDWVAEDSGRSVLITSHNLREVEQLSHRVGIMSRGRLSEVGTVGALRAKFDDRELVRILFDSAASRLEDCFGVVKPDELSFGEAAGGLRFVEFRRRANDDTLDEVIRIVLLSGAKIRAIDRQEMSLQDIVDRVDGLAEAKCS